MFIRILLDGRSAINYEMVYDSNVVIPKINDEGKLVLDPFTLSVVLDKIFQNSPEILLKLGINPDERVLGVYITNARLS